MGVAVLLGAHDVGDRAMIHAEVYLLDGDEVRHVASLRMPGVPNAGDDLLLDREDSDAEPDFYRVVGIEWRATLGGFGLDEAVIRVHVMREGDEVVG